MLAKTGQLVRIPFARHDGTDDAQACHARDVADHFGQLEVHQLQGFLHVLNVRRTIPNQVVAMSRQRTHGTDLFGRSKGGAQQPIGM